MMVELLVFTAVLFANLRWGGIKNAFRGANPLCTPRLPCKMYVYQNEYGFLIELYQDLYSNGIS